MAINNGNTDAYNNIAAYYYNIEHNQELCIKYLLLSIKVGDIDAYIHLSKILINEDKHTEANEYLMFAADKGNEEAINMLADYYSNYEKNYNMGIEKLNTESMIQLGLYYIENTNNNLKAYKLFSQALKLKDNDAIIPLSIYFHKIKDYKNEKKYLDLAYENKIRDAKYFLGKYYWEVENNSDKMKELITQCDEKIASEYLGRYFVLNVMNDGNQEEKEKYIIKYLDNKEYNELEIKNKVNTNNNNIVATFHEKVGYCYMCKSNDCSER